MYFQSRAFKSFTKQGVNMRSCDRCGSKFQHNDLVTVFKEAKERKERKVVCLKCKDILNKKE